MMMDFMRWVGVGRQPRAVQDKGGLLTWHNVFAKYVNRLSCEKSKNLRWKSTNQVDANAVKDSSHHLLSN